MAVLPAPAGDTVKAAVKDAYDGLKTMIGRKRGESALISKAIGDGFSGFSSQPS